MSHVVILGAGFSRALSEHMPLTDELGDQVMSSIELRMNSTRVPTKFTAGRFESWLSRLAEAQPDLDDVVNAENRALFLRVSERIQEVLWEAQCRVMSEPLKWWAQRFIGALHARRSTVATFNYDTLIECAVRIPLRRNWQQRGLLSGVHVVRDRPPSPAHGAWLGPEVIDSFKLLKLHGSIDTYWVADDHSGATINRLPLIEDWREPDGTETDNREIVLPGRVPFIVPPAAAKSSFYTNPLTRQLWRETAEALRVASQVDIVGYSLPPTDLVASGMLADVLAPTDAAIRVVNPTPGSVTEQLQKIGVSRDRITEIATGDFLREYVDELEHEARPFAGASREFAKQALDENTPILIATSDMTAAPAVDIRIDEKTSIAHIAAGSTAPIDHIQAAYENNDLHIARVGELFSKDSLPERAIVSFENEKQAYVVSVSTYQQANPQWLVLIPSSVPSAFDY